MKKIILLSLLAFVSIALNAQEPVLVDGLWYKINNWDGSATVVANPNNEGYSGDIVIPDVVNIGGEDHNVTGIGYRAFCGCNILSVTIGKNVTSIDGHAFSYSTVASAIIGGEFDESTNNNLWIGYCAFYECLNLTSVVLGDNVRSISSQAFQNCPSLSSVVLGKRVRWIGTSSFVGCENLKDVYCFGESSPYQDGGRIFADDQLNSLTLHVPEAYYDNYIVSDPDNYPWSHFGSANQLQSTELVKCATPVISYDNGNISFTCATEGVKYNSSVEYVDNEFNDVPEYPAPSHFVVKVVAVKNGFLPSDVAKQEFALESYVDVKTGDYKQGDVNKDGNVNVADHVKLSDFIMNK